MPLDILFASGEESCDGQVKNLPRKPQVKRKELQVSNKVSASTSNNSSAVGTFTHTVPLGNVNSGKRRSVTQVTTQIAQVGRVNETAKNAARERTRVKSLRDAFSRLQSLIPNVPPDTKLSKLDVLILASSYIRHLMHLLQVNCESLESPDASSRSSSWDGVSLFADSCPVDDNHECFAVADSMAHLTARASNSGSSKYLRPVRKWPMRSRLYAGAPTTMHTATVLPFHDNTKDGAIKSSGDVALQQSSTFDSIDCSETIFYDRLDYFALSSPTRVTDVPSYFIDTQVASLVNYEWDSSIFDTPSLHLPEQVDTNSILTSTSITLDSTSCLSDLTALTPLDTRSLGDFTDPLSASPSSSLAPCQL